jgi:hypothetical protein
LPVSIEGRARRGLRRDHAGPGLSGRGRKLELDINPVSGRTTDDLLAEAYATPKEVLKKASEAAAK